MDMAKGFALDYNAITEDPAELAVTRRLASKIRDKMYLSVEEMLDDMSQEDITQLLNLSTVIDLEGKPHFPSVRHAYIYGLMMASAEGVITLTSDNADTYARYAWGFLAMESLYRKGIVEFDRKSASFVNDTASCKIKPEYREELKEAAPKFMPPTAGT